MLSLLLSNTDRETKEGSGRNKEWCISKFQPSYCLICFYSLLFLRLVFFSAPRLCSSCSCSCSSSSSCCYVLHLLFLLLQLLLLLLLRAHFHCLVVKLLYLIFYSCSCLLISLHQLRKRLPLRAGFVISSHSLPPSFPPSILLFLNPPSSPPLPPPPPPSFRRTHVNVIFKIICNTNLEPSFLPPLLPSLLPPPYTDGGPSPAAEAYFPPPPPAKPASPSFNTSLGCPLVR